MCIVSDLDVDTFMYHNDYNYINQQIAERICQQPKLYDCRYEGWNTEQFFAKLPDFFIDVFQEPPSTGKVGNP